MKMPAAWTNTSAREVKHAVEAHKHDHAHKVTVTKDAVTVTAAQGGSHIDMSDEVAGRGLCPDCHKPMEPYVAGGVDVLACMGCRVTLPTPDDGEMSSMSELDLAPFR